MCFIKIVTGGDSTYGRSKSKRLLGSAFMHLVQHLASADFQEIYDDGTERHGEDDISVNGLIRY